MTSEPRKPFGPGWKRIEEFRGTVVWEHRSGAWATSSVEQGTFDVQTDVEHEEFVKKAFGMFKADRLVHSGSKVLLSL